MLIFPCLFTEFRPTQDGFLVDFDAGCPFCNIKISSSIFDHLFRYHLNRQYLFKGICKELKVDPKLVDDEQKNSKFIVKDQVALHEKLLHNILPNNITALYSCSKCSFNVSQPHDLKSHILNFDHYPRSVLSRSTPLFQHFNLSSQALLKKRSPRKFQIKRELKPEVKPDKESLNKDKESDEVCRQTKLKIKEIVKNESKNIFLSPQVVSFNVRRQILSSFEPWNIPISLKTNFEIEKSEWLDEEETIAKHYGRIVTVNV